MKLLITFDEDTPHSFKKDVLNQVNYLAESCNLEEVGEEYDRYESSCNGIIPTTFIEIVSRVYSDYPIFYEYTNKYDDKKERGYYHDGECFVELNGDYQRC